MHRACVCMDPWEKNLWVMNDFFMHGLITPPVAIYYVDKWDYFHRQHLISLVKLLLDAAEMRPIIE